MREIQRDTDKEIQRDTDRYRGIQIERYRGIQIERYRDTLKFTGNLHCCVEQFTGHRAIWDTGLRISGTTTGHAPLGSPLYTVRTGTSHCEAGEEAAEDCQAPG